MNKSKVSSRKTEWTSISMPEPPPASRAELVARVLDDQLPVNLVAAAAGVCPRTVRTWTARYQAEGPNGLADRSSRPHRQPRGHSGSPSSPASRRCVSSACRGPRLRDL